MNFNVFYKLGKIFYSIQLVWYFMISVSPVRFMVIQFLDELKYHMRKYPQEASRFQNQNT